MEEVRVVYEGIEIVYDESIDRWYFTLNGRDRSADTLAKAKVAIDNPKPNDKVPFQNFEAYLCDYSGENPKLVTVTGIGEKEEYWISVDGKRSRESGWRFREASPENRTIVGQMDVLYAQRAALMKEVRVLAAKLTKL